MLSFAVARCAPARPIRSFEDWVVNAFGRRLYEIFFRTYTEKVWGIPCRDISADWATQRIKGLSIPSLIRTALGKRANGNGSVIKTLIDEFRYPARGPESSGTRWPAWCVVPAGGFSSASASWRCAGSAVGRLPSSRAAATAIGPLPAITSSRPYRSAIW
jgi:hypothetical protein